MAKTIELARLRRELDSVMDQYDFPDDFNHAPAALHALAKQLGIAMPQWGPDPSNYPDHPKPPRRKT